MNLRDMLFGFDGRIRRRDWWVWSIVCGLTYVVAIAVTGLVLMGSARLVDGADPVIGSDPLWLAVAVVIHVPVVWIQAALAAKRAHDRNHSARLVVALVLVVAVLTYLPANDWMQGDAEVPGYEAPLVLAGLAVGLFSTAVNIGLLIVLGILDGTPGPNRYGRSPKGIGGDSADKAAEVFS